jgi:hypothetical protein
VWSAGGAKAEQSMQPRRCPEPQVEHRRGELSSAGCPTAA